MGRNTSVEKVERSAVKLTVTIPGKEVQEAYDETVKKYGTSAQIKGFGKGKVPRDVLERKFGEAFRAETLQNLSESSVAEAIESVDEKPLPYARPTLLDDDLELEPGKKIAFSVQYDVFPEITLGEYKGLTIEEPQVKITKDDEARELEELRQQNALVVEKDDGAAAAGDIITVTFEELGENDAPVDGTRQEDLVLTLGSAHNLYHIDEELVGIAKDESRIIEKEFPEDFTHSEIAGTSKRIRATCTLIKERDVPDLDDEFAQDINDEFETLDDLRKDLRKKLEENAAARIRRRKIDALMEQIVAGSTVEIPETMALTELELSWQNLAQQYRATPEQMEQLLASQGSSKRTIFGEWRPAAEERLRRSLITSKLIELEGIEATEEEAEAQIREDAEKRNADAERILEYYKAQGMLSHVQQEIVERRLFDLIFEASTIKKGPKLSYVDVVAENE
jgi:trigger factor